MTDLITDVDRKAWCDYEDFDGEYRARVMTGAWDETSGLIEFAKFRVAVTAEAADEIAALRARVAEMEAALEWYGEQARLARLIHSGGDAGRHALADDGGKRARAAIAAIGGDRG